MGKIYSWNTYGPDIDTCIEGRNQDFHSGEGGGGVGVPGKIHLRLYE